MVWYCCGIDAYIIVRSTGKRFQYIACCLLRSLLSISHIVIGLSTTRVPAGMKQEKMPLYGRLAMFGNEWEFQNPEVFYELPITAVNYHGTITTGKSPR